MFKTIFALPGSTRIILASLIGRAPTSVFDVALVLFVAERDGLVIAGLAAGASNALGSLAAPLIGRALDRYGRKVLLGAVILHALLLVALLLSWSALPLVLFSALSGIARPPLSSIIRAGWTRLAAPCNISLQANRFESLTSQVVTVIGPLVCAAALAAGSALLALAIAGLGITIGGLILSSTPKLFGTVERKHNPSPLRNQSFRRLMIVAAVAGMATGALQVGLPAKSLEIGEPAWAALWYGAQPAGGIIFTLFLAHYTYWHRSLPALYLLAAAGLLLAPAACLLGSWALLIGMLVCGLLTGAVLIAAYQAAQHLVNEKVLTEAFAAKGAAAYVGVGIGVAALGPVAAQQAVWALACAPLLALIAATLAALWKLDWCSFA